MINQYQADGLPNITGSVSNISQTFGQYGAVNGCFSKGSSRAGETPDSADSGPTGILYFDASRSSSIYGKSSFVQPKNVSLLPILKY